MFAGNFAPLGWMICEGQLLPISEYETLFFLIGTTYGGDGESTFALPDLRGRIPIHMGNTYTLAQNGGVESVTLTIGQIPAHTHPLLASNSSAGIKTPSNMLYAEAVGFNPYVPGSTGNTNMNPGVIGSVGGSQPHENMQPFLCLNFIISLFGIFPSQT